MTLSARPFWTVLLICGASGAGKSTAARALAARHGAAVTEADDLVTGFKAVTTADSHPLLHYWDTHPEIGGWTPQRIARLHFAVAAALQPAFRAIAAHHLSTGGRCVFEGDYLLPDLADGLGPSVRTVVLDEHGPQIARNYRAREPLGGEQTRRARVSALVARRLARQARVLGVPVVRSRPWADVVDRTDAALAGSRFPGPERDPAPRPAEPRRTGPLAESR